MPSLAAIVAAPIAVHAAGISVSVASCEAVDVQQALDDAADGTTLLIPAGSCDWHAQSVHRSAGVRIIGAGRDVTYIKRSNAPTGNPGYALVIDCSNGLTTELAGITFEGKGITSAQDSCPKDNPVQGDAGRYPVPDQTMLAWIWSNTWGGDAQQFIRTSAEESFNCNYYFQEERNYFQYAKPGYTPYHYPHPLRDVLFQNGFE